VRIPPLRERRDDVLPLARLFLATQNQALGRRLAGWTDAAERWLLSHDWPGNVRELEHAIERGAVLCRGELIDVADLAFDAPSARAAGAPSGDDGLQSHLDRAAADHIQDVLRRSAGVRVEAARRLGIERTTLYRLLKRYHIDG
jgi:two-component system, NtrC family, response regulator HydG